MSDHTTQQKNHIYIFIGPEGAGKSTQARMLANELQLPLVSTGDMLRHFAKEDTGFLGDAARDMFSKNGYLDANLINQIVAETLRDPQYSKGVILDGSLRTYDETVHFDDVFEQAKLHLPVVVFSITVPEEESIQRLVFGRKRSDDTISGVRRRLLHFKEKLQERMAIIAKKYALIEIDGVSDKDKVHNAIMQQINKLYEK